MNEKTAQLTQTGRVALGVGGVGEACLNTQAGDIMQFIHSQTEYWHSDFSQFDECP